MKTAASVRCLLTFLMLHASVAGAGAGVEDARADTERKVFWSRVAGVAAVTGWGLWQWDYFEHEPHRLNEGWLEAGTREGGADKFGHLYIAHVTTQVLADLYSNWGLDRRSAARQSALTSLLVLGYMEIGDSFSPAYGFSAEDMAFNLAGSLIGYGLVANHTWRHRLDLRVEYRPGSGRSDIFTDYGHSKYLAAIKLDGFESFRVSPLRWLEIQVGYYARGYGEPAPDSRHAYLGVGLNFAALATQAGFPRTGQLLHYWQPPGTTLVSDYEISSR